MAIPAMLSIGTTLLMGAVTMRINCIALPSTNSNTMSGIRKTAPPIKVILIKRITLPTWLPDGMGVFLA